MKKIISLWLALIFIFAGSINAFCICTSVDEISLISNGYEYQEIVDASVSVDTQLMTYAKSVVLMEKSTGKILYAENEHEKLYPASVTKIMTILLVCEALQSGKIKLSDNVICSENAASKGGSQIWLEEGETMTVEELLKATCVYSANDACTLLGEYVSGSETAFISLMNERAAELGMNDTHFDNCTGLDDTTETHLTSSYDIALMSRELLKYGFIKEYTTIWMDSLRNGTTELVNTNKLVRYYKGITGLKTGTTEKAGCCVCATAERDSMELIAVVLGSENSKDRFKTAENLLDWGFANYEIFTPEISNIPEKLPIKLGNSDFVAVEKPSIAPLLINKGVSDSITYNIETSEDITAPVLKNDVLGKIRILINENCVAEYELKASETAEKLSFAGAMLKLLRSFS